MISSIEKKEILSIEECTELLSISKRNMYALFSQEREPGKIFGRKVARKWRIHRSEIEKLLTEELPLAYQMRMGGDKR
jgi:predicted DNA-binding transcriptional regulator AlpA